MRIVVTGLQANIISKLLAASNSELDVHSAYVDMKDIPQFISSFQGDGLVLADDWPLTYYVLTLSDLPLFPIITYTSSYYKDTVQGLREKSIYPMSIPESMDDIYNTICTQLTLLEQEIRSSNRVDLAKEAAQQLIASRFAT